MIEKLIFTVVTVFVRLIAASQLHVYKSTIG